MEGEPGPSWLKPGQRLGVSYVYRSHQASRAASTSGSIARGARATSSGWPPARRRRRAQDAPSLTGATWEAHDRRCGTGPEPVETTTSSSCRNRQLAYQDKGRVTGDGCHWRQNGSAVLIEVNDCYAKDAGTITREPDQGEFSNEVARGRRGPRTASSVVAQSAMMLVPHLRSAPRPGACRCRGTADCRRIACRPAVAPGNARRRRGQGVDRYGRRLRQIPGTRQRRTAQAGLGSLAALGGTERAVRERRHPHPRALDGHAGSPGPASHAGHRSQRPRPLRQRRRHVVLRRWRQAHGVAHQRHGRHRRADADDPRVPAVPAALQRRLAVGSRRAGRGDPALRAARRRHARWWSMARRSRRGAVHHVRA